MVRLRNGDGLSSAGLWMDWFRVIRSSTNGMAGALTGQTYTALCIMKVRCGSAALGVARSLDGCDVGSADIV